LVDRIDCTNCLNTTYTVNQSSLVTLEIIDNNGCIILGNTFIALNEISTDIYIPNAISPINKDGINDFLIPYKKESDNYKIISFSVYNRWGGHIFESQNALFNEETTGWDGTINGTKVQSGVYVYDIVISLPNGSIIRLSSDVTVL